MTFGYSCDAMECNKLQDSAFATITLNLDSLPLQQQLTLALNLHQEDIIDLDDAAYMQVMNALRGKGAFDRELPTVELHLCPGHALTALSAVGAVELEDETNKEVGDTTEEQQS